MRAVLKGLHLAWYWVFASHYHVPLLPSFHHNNIIITVYREMNEISVRATLRGPDHEE